MKKKIGDLTYEEMQEVCKYQKCDNCPLNITHTTTCILTIKDLGYLDKEVEVEE